MSVKKPKEQWQTVPWSKTSTSTSTPRTYDINKFHKLLGHVNEKYLRKTARFHNIQLTGHLEECVPCALAKLHANPISKEPNNRSRVPGERLFIDISHFPHPRIANSKYWLLILDDDTNMLFSTFLKQKSESVGYMISFIKKIKDRGTSTRYVRLDNSGENVLLQKMTADMNITYEFTAPDTPQQNGRVERKFAVLTDCIRSLLNTAQLPDTLRKKCWAEAANHSTDLINGTCTTQNEVPPFTKFYGEKPPYFKYLQPFGELCVTSTLVNKKVKSKTANRGTLALYLGRAQNHAPDTYRLFKLDTNKVIISRNVKFTRLMYADYFRTEISLNRYKPLSDDDDDDDDDAVIPSNDAESSVLSAGNIQQLQQQRQSLIPTYINNDTQHNNNEHQDTPSVDDNVTLPTVASTPNPKLIRELRKLDGFFNPPVQQVLGSMQPRATVTSPTTTTNPDKPLLDNDQTTAPTHDTDTTASPATTSTEETSHLLNPDLQFDTTSVSTLATTDITTHISETALAMLHISVVRYYDDDAT